jgi:hypothetical protein
VVEEEVIFPSPNGPVMEVLVVQEVLLEEMLIYGHHGLGNTPPTSPSQGNNGGGSGYPVFANGGGGGGGAGGAGNTWRSYRRTSW